MGKANLAKKWLHEKKKLEILVKHHDNFYRRAEVEVIVYRD